MKIKIKNKEIASKLMSRGYTHFSFSDYMITKPRFYDITSINQIQANSHLDFGLNGKEGYNLCIEISAHDYIEVMNDFITKD